MTRINQQGPPEAEAPKGYQDIPESDRRKAQVFFDRGAAVAGTGQYEYAIEMYLQGLGIDPENIAAHQAMRDIALRRKASGGKDLGIFEKKKLQFSRPRDDKQAMLTAEKLIAYEPGGTDSMLWMMESAHRAGYYDTVMWIGAILQQANSSLSKPDYGKYIKLRDIYKALGQWKEAVDACNLAARMRQDDMDLQRELKDLGAQLTMSAGKYASGGSFRDSIRDMDAQQKLLEQDKGVFTADSIQRAIHEAEEELKADPEEPGKLIKLVEALRRSEAPESENRAIELLEANYQRNAQFRWRKLAGEIKLGQLKRMDRSLRVQLRDNPTDEDLAKQVRQFQRDRAEEELKEYKLWAENYPTESEFKFEMAKRMFMLSKFDDAIPVFQDVRNDPKYRTDAQTLLARAFLGAGYVDESADTLRELINVYQLKGDARSIEMYYWYGRALEQQGDADGARKAYSQVAQWNFNYQDVQQRIKKIRGGGGGNGGSAGGASAG
jgi:tetratricopeptide (TPR) repeat protein